VGQEHPESPPLRWWQASDGKWYPPEARWTPGEEAYLAAAQLSQALRDGWRPPPVDAPIALPADERVFHLTEFILWTFSATTARYNTGWFAAFGSPLWLAASLGGSALYNHHQRTQAEARAAAQWRLANQGILYVTGRRLCLQAALPGSTFRTRPFVPSSPSLTASCSTR
jgi:hypothetical protein